MGRKGKGIRYEQKLEALEKYLHGQGSQQSIAREYGIGKTTFQQWIANYESMGPSGLLTTIEDYIHFYNYKRRQKRLNKLPPMTYRQQLESAA